MFLDIEILKDLLIEMGGEVKFESPVRVKMTPHSNELRIRILSLENETMIAYGDVNIEVSEPSPLSNTLIQRLRLIKHNDSAATID